MVQEGRCSSPPVYKKEAVSSGKSLKEVAFDLDYHTSTEDAIETFYGPCLERATKYDRAAGYFRASVLEIVTEQVMEFAKNDGLIRVICSPYMNAEDISDIEKGYAHRDSIIASCLIRDFESMKVNRDSQLRLSLLATLVAHGVMDIKIAFMRNTLGMYHEKLGIFRDRFGNGVSFKGSSNETLLGWSHDGNADSFDVFCSWRSGGDNARVKRHAEYFEKLWDGNIHSVEVVSFPDVARSRLEEESQDSIEMMASRLGKRSSNSGIQAFRPFRHQEEAIENWRRQGSRGILEHATGSGKTFTAILAIREHLEKGFPALIVAPSIILLQQWASEVKKHMPKCRILLAGGDHTRWKRGSRLASFTSDDAQLGPRVVISVLATAASELFREKVKQGDHLLFVADEVHRTGSRVSSNVLDIVTGPRLGLSATPIRYGDPEGTKRIFAYFGSVVPPKYALADAISDGRLVPYYYYPHISELDDEECDRWEAITLKLSRHLASNKQEEDIEIDDYAKLLLIKRANIAKTASSKIEKCTDILRENYEEDQRWLIYCENIEQLKRVQQDIYEELGIQSLEYHYRMEGDKKKTLEWFAQNGGIIVSIRCLDEGVDIPESTHALILASSKNPREFIQRRGRVLRKPKRIIKPYATIFDVLAMPPLIESDQLLYKSLIGAELARCIRFSDDALNPSSASAIRQHLIEAGLVPNELLKHGYEVEDEVKEDDED